MYLRLKARDAVCHQVMRRCEQCSVLRKVPLIRWVCQGLHYALGCMSSHVEKSDWTLYEYVVDMPGCNNTIPQMFVLQSFPTDSPEVSVKVRFMYGSSNSMHFVKFLVPRGFLVAEIRQALRKLFPNMPRQKFRARRYGVLSDMTELGVQLNPTGTRSFIVIDAEPVIVGGAPKVDPKAKPPPVIRQTVDIDGLPPGVATPIRGDGGSLSFTPSPEADMGQQQREDMSKRLQEYRAKKAEEDAAKAAAKAKAKACPACDGAHRAHTCGKPNRAPTGRMR